MLSLLQRPAGVLSILLAAALLLFAVPTAGAQQLVKDINPGPDSSAIGGLAPLGGTLLFPATDGSNGIELWKSDGTASGTQLVKDINPGPVGSSPQFISVLSGVLYFAAADGSNGEELWRTDGTAGGTQLIKDINPGPDSSSIEGLINFNGEVYFVADDGTSGQELWKSDGTASGTQLVKDINPGASASSPSGAVVFNGALYFAADDGANGIELWKTDGTSGGTQLVKDINPTPVSFFTGNSIPSGLSVFNNTLYFSADDGSNGRELWKSDGTAAGTQMVVDLNPGTASALSFFPILAPFNNMLYFAANDGNSGTELWKSDGTASGTQLVKDINPNPIAPPGPGGPVPGSSSPSGFAVLSGTLYFIASDQVNPMAVTPAGVSNRELWKTDGTTAGTQLVKDINPGPDGSLFLTALFAIGSNLVFSADDGSNGQELWRSNGTTARTELVADINPGPNDSLPFPFIPIGNTVYFTADDGTNGRELWRIDGQQLPVELASFEAVLRGSAVELSWRTLSEEQNAGFEVQRKVAGGAFQKIGFVEGAGTTLEAQHYRFADERVPFGAGRVIYRLRQVDFDGQATYGPEVEVEIGAPERFVLRKTFPNPASHEATLRYELPRAAHVRLSVYDVLGRRVATLVDSEQAAGRHEARLEVSRLVSGTYFCRLQAGGNVAVRQILVVR